MNLEQAEEGTWRKKEMLRPEDLARKLPWGGWSQEGEGP
jgi:hypothetical protein